MTKLSNKRDARKWLIVLFVGVLAAMLIALVVSRLYVSANGNGSASAHKMGDEGKNMASEAEILYWVAPMDANFRRDKPGKSPMGMDLVPVYANDNGAASADAGLVQISARIENNLGVKTDVVKFIPNEVSLHLSGQLAFAQDNIAHIHPRVTGWIEKLYVRSVGEEVTQGDALYTLYSPELVNAQEEYLLALKQANSNIINAAQARLQALNLPLKAIEEIRQTQLIQREVTFYAPQSGVIKELNIQEGFYVSPSKTMLSIAAIDQLWAILDVFASDAAKLAVGQTVYLNSEFFLAQQITTQVAYIYPTLEPTKKTLQARVNVSNTDKRLKPGMFVSAQLDTKMQNTHHEASEVLVVLRDAVIDTGKQTRAVLALGDGQYKSIAITTGRLYGSYIEVVEGLREGDKIVSSAQFLLDSESSISSDFSRIDGNDTPLPDTSGEVSAWTHATVEEVFIDEAMLKLSHGPLAEFNMMGMTMNFLISDSLNINDFRAGQDLHVEIVKSNSGMYKVSTVHFMQDSTEATVDSPTTANEENQL
ncbi:efflux RND transporter periplasmic adaptor subunit [Glaciecola sp. MH2013]|uniref:efflux RND transporter periplasmic adaptor subunit n=1 Tax=Glaciecola sp. MH2013 TaxID=2785524 RepID=UPI00189CA256|nr:efflux RND transporter periplasmic adaptor subunit [Glaciecola sp. MH2013]MBF7073071.1 efflux RND transporter periplasmic adaptor subunit [Glaciecola sp. MH2013]